MIITLHNELTDKESLAVLLDQSESAKNYCRTEKESDYIKSKLTQENKLVRLDQLDRNLFFICLPNKKKENYQVKEELRNTGYDLYQFVKTEKIKNLQFISVHSDKEQLLALIEGFALSTYQFDKYKSDKKNHQFESIILLNKDFSKDEIDEFSNLLQAVFIVRNLVNEPVVYLTAEKLAEEAQNLSKEAGFSAEVFHKDKIASLRMNGLLAVNRGSNDPPTFTVLEYKPKNAINEKPYILVGKGVVFDTGGLSLKPTPSSMDYMKCDMSGAGTVIGTIYAIAKNKLPVYLVGLIPATDNRPGENAFVPGDVITMMNGKTVEVLNTDAEGRLILSDALCFAGKYEPVLTIDLATLTGSALRAVGYEACVMMGTADKEWKNRLIASSEETYERMVEFPLWDEYEEHIKSDIADINNLGKAEAGSISAGKFLQHFTTYPWIHLDIAGTAFLHTAGKYRGKGGTAYGVRLLYHFFKNIIEKK